VGEPIEFVIDAAEAPIKEAFATLEEAAGLPGQPHKLELGLSVVRDAIAASVLGQEQRTGFTARLGDVLLVHKRDPGAAVLALNRLSIDIRQAIFRHVITADAARASIIETFARLDVLSTVDLTANCQEQVRHVRRRLAALVAQGDLSWLAPNFAGLAVQAQGVFDRTIADLCASTSTAETRSNRC
jgi:hypothetical protein